MTWDDGIGRWTSGVFTRILPKYSRYRKEIAYSHICPARGHAETAKSLQFQRRDSSVFKKVLAAVALTLAAVFAVPMAANAAGYVPSSNVTVSNSTPAPGQTVVVSFKSSSFLPGENVQFTLTGEDAASASLASLRAAVNSKSIVKPATSTGAVSVSVTLPTDATGTYTLTATGATSGNVGTVSLTVTPIDAVTASGPGSSSGGLAKTGSTISLIAIWVAGGLVLLGGAFVAVNVIVRRQRAKA